MSSSQLPPTIEDHERLHTSLTGRDFLSLRDLTAAEVLELFDRALRMKADPLKFSNALRGKTLAMIFEKPSLRTRVSFDVGMVQLGGHAARPVGRDQPRQARVDATTSRRTSSGWCRPS